MSDLRCPRCGAVLRPGDQWCGLCFADFREPPPVVGDSTAPAEATPAAAALPGDLAPPLIRPPGAVAPAPTPPPAAQPAAAQPAAAQPTGSPAAQPVPAIPTQPLAARPSPFVPSTNPLAPMAAVPTQLPAGVAPAPSDAAAAETDAEAAADEPMWPCPRCGERVPMTEDYCASCGHGFLDDVRRTAGTKLPFVGDVSKLNSGQKLAFGSVIAFAIIVVILLLLAVGGAILH